ncbi:Inositol 2-dehydrogenase [Anatilimnocola aggregata]|uniref:Inositol 2-dehydrogenase n=1 Tax=Anatilimnocola aggregata TaxID=2528021 RepID=A0A517YNP8_9BACT|nr:Gfo/Idh/MocA family oxidoreductase [Anatilimnocola aggregata]QDU31839.1 Inositol 2-dehydrogenase [Anatilimnocola aggregata]
MTSPRTNRRRFLANSLAASAAGVTLTNLHAQAFAAAGNRPKRVALIGCGWYGKCDLYRLLQVSPVEVVSLCDVDKNMVAACADEVAARQVSKKKPRTYGDYRELLKEKDVDIVLVDTPDHWHALPMIAACEAGADVWVQKPISLDIAEGQAMVAAARKHKRVVQVGTQRRSTPHLIEARDRIINEGKLGKIALVEIYCYYHMRAKDNPPDSSPPDNLDYEMWTGPASMRPYNSLVHPRRWRAFNEYGNGIVGDMCIHMLDMVRWMLDLGWPQRIGSAGGILVDKASKANISDTQQATFDFGNLQVVWQHRSWGAPPDPKYPWGATFYGDKGTLKASVNSYDFTPMGGGQPVHADVKMELEEFPEDKTEKDLEKHVAPAIRGHMKDFLANIESRGKPVSDIEQGHITTAACILANHSMQLGRSLTWDAGRQLVVNDDAANKLLQRPYRAPWKHPADA